MVQTSATCGFVYYLMSRLLKAIIAPLLMVAPIENAIAYGFPDTEPCHTAIITPADRTNNDIASCHDGYIDITRTDMMHATTGIADRMI